MAQSSKTATSIDAILERLPYGDGALRRRFIAGGVILLGLAIGFWPSIEAFKLTGPVALLPASVLAAFTVMLAYALGTATETLQTVFLLPAAARVVPRIFRALQTEPAFSTEKDGDSSLLSAPAAAILRSFPPSVLDGLRNPLGRNGELATHYLTTRMTAEEDRRWARKLMARTADLAVATTAGIIILLSLTPIVLGPLTGRGDASTTYWNTIDAIDNVWKDRDRRIAAVLEDLPTGSLRGTARWGGTALRAYLQRRDRAVALSPLSAEESTAVRVDVSNLVEEIKHRIHPKARTRAETVVTARLQDYAVELRLVAADVELAAHALARARVSAWLFVAMSVGATLPILLLLYAGYFLLLRNGLIAIVETLAVREILQTSAETSAHPFSALRGV
jgi:hypothetical protein